MDTIVHSGSQNVEVSEYFIFSSQNTNLKMSRSSFPPRFCPSRKAFYCIKLHIVGMRTQIRA